MRKIRKALTSFCTFPPPAEVAVVSSKITYWDFCDLLQVNFGAACKGYDASKAHQAFCLILALLSDYRLEILFLSHSTLLLCFSLFSSTLYFSTSSKALFKRTSVALWVAAACFWARFRFSNSYLRKDKSNKNIINNGVLMNPVSTTHLQKGSPLKAEESVNFFGLQIESVSKTILLLKHPLLLWNLEKGSFSSLFFKLLLE